MTKRTVWLMATSLLIGLLCSTGQAAEPCKVPFDQALARMEMNDHVKIVFTVFKPVWVMKEEAYTVTVKVPVKKIDPVTNQEQTFYEERSEVRTRQVKDSYQVPELRTAMFRVDSEVFLELDGTPADPSSLAERLMQQTLVVVTHNGKPLPSQYAALFRTGTLVIAIPPCDDEAPMAPPEPMVDPSALAPPPTAPVPAKRQARAQQAPFFFVAQDAAPPAVEHDGFTLPAGTPPTFQMAGINEQDDFALSTVVAEDRMLPAYVVASKKVMIGEGELKEIFETKQLTITQQMQSSTTTLYPRDSVTGQTVDGSPMEDRHLTALRQRQIPVIVSRDGKPVDPLWLGNLKPKMLILVPPTTNNPFAGQEPALAPAPAPAPVAPSPPRAPQA